MSNLLLSRVDTGESLLDEDMPGWRDKIDLSTLDLMSTENCVLGQLYGSYVAGLYALRRNFDTEWAVAYGFSATGEYDYGYEELTAEWKKRISNHN